MPSVAKRRQAHSLPPPSLTTTPPLPCPFFSSSPPAPISRCLPFAAADAVAVGHRRTPEILDAAVTNQPPCSLSSPFSARRRLRLRRLPRRPPTFPVLSFFPLSSSAHRHRPPSPNTASTAQLPCSSSVAKHHQPATSSFDVVSLSPPISSLGKNRCRFLYFSLLCSSSTLDVHCRRGLDAALNKLRRHPGPAPPSSAFFLSFTVTGSFVLNRRLSRTPL